MSDAQAVFKTIEDAATSAAARQALVSDPRKVLTAAGASVPANTKILVHVNDAKTFHAVLPEEAQGELELVRKLNPLAAKVYEKAWRDPAYKKQLMTSPREAFIAATGVKPPASLKLVAHENTAGELHLVVPHKPTASELSDADLEHVAGGKGEVAVQKACDETAGAGSAMLGLAAALGPVSGPVAAVAALGGLAVGFGGMIGSAAK